jgi:hypothetical protein
MTINSEAKVNHVYASVQGTPRNSNHQSLEFPPNEFTFENKLNPKQTKQRMRTPLIYAIVDIVGLKKTLKSTEQ